MGEIKGLSLYSTAFYDSSYMEYLLCFLCYSVFSLISSQKIPSMSDCMGGCIVDWSSTDRQQLIREKHVVSIHQSQIYHVFTGRIQFSEDYP